MRHSAVQLSASHGRQAQALRKVRGATSESRQGWLSRPESLAVYDVCKWHAACPCWLLVLKTTNKQARNDTRMDSPVCRWELSLIHTRRAAIQSQRFRSRKASFFRRVKTCIPVRGTWASCPLPEVQLQHRRASSQCPRQPGMRGRSCEAGSKTIYKGII